MATFPVTLGSFVFKGFEVPQRAPFGGDQAMAIHKLIGGARVIDTMGRDDAAIKWEGLFLSPDADKRALQLDQLRVAGAPLVLSWGAHRNLVVIRSFLPVFERNNKVPYSIACEVLQDMANPTPAAAKTPDQDVNTSLTNANAAGSNITFLSSP
jgi:hypothetical protein